MYSATRRYIPTYNALKGIASIGIVLSHMSYLSMAGDGTFLSALYNNFFGLLSSFCTFFFVCSGFLAFYTWKCRSFKEYIFGKLKRLYPLTYLVLIAAILVDVLLSGNGETGSAPAGSSMWLFCLAANVLLFKSFIPVETVFYSFHGPSWYVSALFVFYLFSYPVLKGLQSEKRDLWIRILRIVVICTYTIELLLCIVVSLRKWDSLWLCYVNPWFRIFGEGFLGILIAVNIDDYSARVRNHSLFECVSILILLASFMIRNTHNPIFFAWAQAVPVVLVLVAFYDGRGIISRVFTSTGFQFLGDVSFELYMTHAFVYEGLPIVIKFVSSNLSRILQQHVGVRLIITLPLCVFVAWIVHVVMKRLYGLFSAKGHASSTS